jgi:hypothetical protein
MRALDNLMPRTVFAAFLGCALMWTSFFFVADVLLRCFLSRGACPVHNYCQGEQAKCTSTNDRGGQFEFDCGFWTSYYRLDSDVSANCENFQPKVDAVGEPNVEVVNVFAEWKAANPTAPVRSTPVEVSAEVLPQAAGR